MSRGRAAAESVRRLPKAELHVHLEGAVRPATLLRLAARRRVALPASDEASLRQWFRFRDFEHFVQVYLLCCSCLRDPEDFQGLCLDFMEQQAAQNVLYTEAHLTIGTHLANGANGGEVAHAVAEAMAEGERRFGVRLRLICDVVREVGTRRAEQTLGWAVEHRERGVVALGLSGFETTSCAPYREHFRLAAAEGLRRTAHAGEHGGPESIREVLEVCGAERIGHGIAAARDPGLMAELKRREVPLEVCPTSNLRLGAVAAAAEHPIDRLLSAGVPLSVNSDDPSLFDTDLTGELLLLQETFGYPAARLAELSLAAVRHAFLPAAERRELEERFRREIESVLGEAAAGEPGAR